MTSAVKDTLAVVLAHGKAADIVARHLPFWQEQAREVVFFTPTDDVLPGTYWQYGIGKSKAYSADTNQRCRSALRFASFVQAKYTLLFEYDSIILGDIPNKYLPPAGGVSAPVFHDHTPGKKFLGDTYLHFPQMYTRTGLQKVVQAMDALPADAEGGFTDRYVGLAVARSGVPVLDLNLTGFVYTQNEIDEPKLPAAVEAYRKGARWSHGIKTEKVLKALQEAAK